MIKKTKIIDGVYFIEIPEINLYIQCGSPAESVKHLIKKGFITKKIENGVEFETGPNAILLSDRMIQNGEFSNVTEFSILQIIYKQCFGIPNHPNNTGLKPILIGEEHQVISQMQYIHRGNYGLTSIKEIESCDIEPELAQELYSMKLRFSFGKIHPASTLINSCFIKNAKTEIRDGAFIKRINMNIFEISYENEKITIDLNLKNKQKYIAPYTLSQHSLKKEYFSVIQSGQGDGWDTKRPSMNSIICFKGKYYLVDVVPNIHYILDSLSISIDEIEGVFLTHCHDDHIAGITTLMRSDKRIKIYGAKIVTTSLIKKLSSLLVIEPNIFDNLLDIQELKIDKWNNINHLEIKPIISPHTVETTIFIFQTRFNNKHYTYGHFADITASNVLKNMIVKNEKEFGISQKFYDNTIKEYTQTLDIKKIDIGGGLIHGNSQDFTTDQSKKIILAHNDKALTKEQLKIGTSSSFGMQDTLISVEKNYDHDTIIKYLQSSFPTLSVKQIEPFLLFELLSFNPKEILHKKKDKIDNLYLIIAGIVEKSSSRYDCPIMLESGVIIGEKSTLCNQISQSTFIAKNYVKVLKIPTVYFISFVKEYNLYQQFNDKFQIGYQLQKNRLFNENISYPTINTLIKNMTIQKFKKSSKSISNGYIYIIIKGSVNIIHNGTLLKNISQGDYFGDFEGVLNISSIFTYKIIEDSEFYCICSKELKNIPIVFWKILEDYELLKNVYL